MASGMEMEIHTEDENLGNADVAMNSIHIRKRLIQRHVKRTCLLAEPIEGGRDSGGRWKLGPSR